MVVYLGDASDGNVLAVVDGNFGAGMTVDFVASSDGVQSASPVAATPETPAPPADIDTVTATPQTDIPRPDEPVIMPQAPSTTPTSGAPCVSVCTSVAIYLLALLTAGTTW